MTRYRKLFAIEEIEASGFLRRVYWVLLIGFFLSFQDWVRSSAITKSLVEQGKHLCPMYFPECGKLYFLETWPAYSQMAFFALLTAFLIASAVFAWRGRWTLAHALLIPPTLFKIIYVYVLTYQVTIEFEYFHLPEVLVFLFIARKEFFLRRVFLLTYLFAATVKFNDTWIVGGYFTSRLEGMPLFPDTWVPFITNGVILFEIITPWFLLSRRRSWRFTAVGLWTLFHLYSILLVGFRYPAHCLPLLLVLFLPDESGEIRGRAFLGWAFMAAMSLVYMLPWTVKSDNRYTLEGRKFGAQMFNANHQCVSKETRIYPDGREIFHREVVWRNMRRCGPYQHLFRIQQTCRKEKDVRIRWLLASSIDGGPFYRIVDVEDACPLEFKTLGPNPWIQTPDRGAPIVGYPQKNSQFSRGDQGGPIIFPTSDPEMRTSTQTFFADHHRTFALFYKILFVATFLFFAVRRAYRPTS